MTVARMVISSLSILMVAGSPASAVQVLRRAVSVQFSEQSFDKTNFDQLTETGARKKCKELLRANLELIEKGTELNEAQRGKLALAGQLDIHRFFCRYQHAKRGMKFGTISRDEWQQTFADAQAKVRPLREEYAAGLHGESSLFTKAMTSVLEPEQTADIQQLLEARERGRYSSTIKMAIAIIDRKVPLTNDQRTTIIERLLAKTEPVVSSVSTSSQVFQVLAQMRLIEDDLREMLTRQEWDVVNQLIEAAKATTEARNAR